MDDEKFVQEVRAHVRRMVARGDKSFEDLLEDAVEYFLEEYEDAGADQVEKICSKEIEKAFTAHIAAQALWPEITDCDRLDAAFEALNDGGIVARHDFSCCQNCGFAEIGDEIRSSSETGTDVVGFAFYHSQDTDSAADGHGLYLTYGHVDGGEANGIAIGRTIVSALQDAGLKTDWDGTMGKRIGVPLNWQRRIPPSFADE